MKLQLARRCLIVALSVMPLFAALPSSAQDVRWIFGGGYNFRDLDISPDGSTLYSAAQDGTGKSWNLPVFDLQRIYEHTWSSSYESVAVHPSGEFVAFGDYGSSLLRLYRTDDATNVWAVSFGAGTIEGLDFSPDGSHLVVASGRIRIVRTSDGVQVAQGSGSLPTAAAYAPDGSFVVGGFSSGALRAFSASTGAQLWTQTAHSGAVRGLAFSGDGTRVATCGMDGLLRIWRASDGAPLLSLPAHTGGARGVDISGAGIVATGGVDRSVRLWSLDTGASLGSVVFGTEVEAVTFAPDAQRLYVGEQNGLKALAVPSLVQQGATFGHSDQCVELLPHPDGVHLLSSTASASTKVLNLLDGSLGVQWPWGATCMAVTPDGQTAVACLPFGQFGSEVKVWRMSDGQLIQSWSVPDNTFLAVDISTDGQFVYTSGSRYLGVRKYRVSDAALLNATVLHTNSIRCLELSPDGATLATGSDDRTVRLWSSDNLTPIQTLTGSAAIHAIAFSPDGVYLVAGATSSPVFRWVVATGEPLDPVPWNGSFCVDIDFMPTGAEFITFQQTGITAYRMSDRAKILDIPIDSPPVMSGCLSLDASTLSWGKMDGTVTTITNPLMPPAQVSGTITLGDWVASPEGVPVVLELWSDSVLVETLPPVDLGPSSAFSFMTVRRGFYSLAAKGPTWLRRRTAGTISITSAGVSGITMELTNGDCDGDNEVAIGDYAVLSGAYGTSPGDPLWDAFADLNGDTSVDIGDFAILSAHYGETGE